MSLMYNQQSWLAGLESAKSLICPKKVAHVWWDSMYLRANSSYSYERACSLRSHAWALFFFASGTLSFNPFPPGSPPNPNENIKVISAIYRIVFFFQKCHCCFIYLLYLIDSISRDARRESLDVIKLHLDKNFVFYWIVQGMDAFLINKKKQNTKLKGCTRTKFADAIS